jgi:hypothetical protein
MALSPQLLVIHSLLVFSLSRELCNEMQSLDANSRFCTQTQNIAQLSSEKVHKDKNERGRNILAARTRLVIPPMHTCSQMRLMACSNRINRAKALSVMGEETF